MIDCPIKERSPYEGGLHERRQELVDTAVCHHLFRARPIGIRAEDGVVVLHGQVQSFYEKQLAQEVVRQLDSVIRIDNQIEVTYT